MKFAALTWQQVAFVFVCFAFLLAAYKLFGPGAAAIVALAAKFAIAASSKDPPSDPPAPGAAAGAGAVLALVLFLSGCASEPPDGGKLLHAGSVIVHCQDVGRNAPDGGEWRAYDACMRDAGMPR